jgi:serine/threonine-protein kinase HipA
MKRSITIQVGAEGMALGALRYDQQGARESAAFE